MLLDSDAVLFVPAVPDIPGLRELVGASDVNSSRAARAAIATASLSMTDGHASWE